MSPRPLTPLQMERLLCSIWPNRRQRALRHLAGWAWQHSETGPLGWLGDRADGLESWMRERRARRQLAKRRAR